MLQILLAALAVIYLPTTCLFLDHICHKIKPGVFHSLEFKSHSNVLATVPYNGNVDATQLPTSFLFPTHFCPSFSLGVWVDVYLKSYSDVQTDGTCNISIGQDPTLTCV